MTTRKIAMNGSSKEVQAKLWQANGIRLMTHKAPGAIDCFRVSEETTGYAIPNTRRLSEAEAELAAREFIEQHETAIKASIASKPVLNPPEELFA